MLTSGLVLFLTFENNPPSSIEVYKVENNQKKQTKKTKMKSVLIALENYTSD